MYLKMQLNFKENKLITIQKEASLKGSMFSWDEISKDYFKILHINND